MTICMTTAQAHSLSLQLQSLREAGRAQLDSQQAQVVAHRGTYVREPSCARDGDLTLPCHRPERSAARPSTQHIHWHRRTEPRDAACDCPTCQPHLESEAGACSAGLGQVEGVCDCDSVRLGGNLRMGSKYGTNVLSLMRSFASGRGEPCRMTFRGRDMRARSPIITTCDAHSRRSKPRSDAATLPANSFAANGAQPRWCRQLVS